MPNKNFVSKVPVSVPHRSGFDKSFRNLLTAKCGTLVPLMCDELIPNSTVHLDLALSAQLPPLASETFMNVDYKVEAFFVPTRLLMQGYEDWLSGNDVYTSADGQTTRTLRPPIVQFSPGQAKPGTLLDYLGFMSKDYSAYGQMTTNSVVTAFPLLAYHLIYDSWYRNSMVQKSLFINEVESKVDSVFSSVSGYVPAYMKWKTPMDYNNDYIITNSMPFADGSKIFDLRQRNFPLDYFTMATPSAQNGKPMAISLQYLSQSQALAGTDGNLDPSLGNIYPNNNNITYNGFTIASLRAANSMQQFLERNNLIGNRLVDYVRGQYGATLKDSIAQRPVYLGSFSFPVYSKGVYQSNQESSNDVASRNPFNSVGARYGHAYAEGNGSLIDFTAEEPGYIMVIGSLVPEVTYASGCERYLSRYTLPKSQSDMANPILQNVGNQPIYNRELNTKPIFQIASGNVASPVPNAVFGYVERYADWKIRNHQLHGLIRDGSSLESFALQRTIFEDGPTLVGNNFLQIPTDFMDQVSAVADSISDYGVWIDCYFKYAVSMPLYQYSVPSLQDPAWEHGEVFTIPRGGVRID